MSLEQWFKFGWIKKHKTSKQEIDALFEIIERDLKDSKESNVSNDWRFGLLKRMRCIGNRLKISYISGGSADTSFNDKTILCKFS